MFENLKAFIRHGKHANEKHLLNNNIPSSLPASFDGLGFGDAPKKNPVISNVQHEELVNLPSNLSNISEGSKNNSDITLISDKGQEYDSRHYQETEPVEHHHHGQAQQENGTKRNKHHPTNHEVASQIVEQELHQKRQQTKYPNLHNYKVLEQLGEGAFSVVYRAQNLKTGQFVAIKILRKFQMDEKQKQAVLKEVTIMRQLTHPNIVEFIEFIDSEPYYYIVQELVSGGEIFSAIVNYTYLSEELSRHIIVQVAHSIRYLHEEVGIVHRDIKPENLLFFPIEFKPSKEPMSKLRKSDDPNTKLDEGEFIPGVGGGTIGRVKLADFGLSKQIWEHNTKTPCGTVGYTAPEIVRDERYSKEVDMWAIGCVLYTLLCGFPPFYDERIETLTEKVAKGEYTFLSPWWDEISNDAKYCVSKLLTVNPNERYTIDEFLRDPWITKATRKHSMRPPNMATNPPVDPKHPIKEYNKRYSNKFVNNTDLYSPAAVALRDAFDISTSVHRMGEEAKLVNPAPQQMNDLLEEEEDEERVTRSGRVIDTIPQSQHQTHPPKVDAESLKQMFELNLGGASILERRKNKPVLVTSN